MECLDYSTYVTNRMTRLGLSTPSNAFDTYDQMLGKLAQVAAIATLSPAATVGSVAAGALTAPGLLPAIGLLSAVGGMYYLGAFAGSLFFAAAENQLCKNTNKLNATMLTSWMKSKGIYDVHGLDAEFLKHPELSVA